MTKQNKLRFSGFTLIEILIVISIIGILTAISIGSYSRAQVKSRDTTRKSSVLAIQSALEQYKSVNSVYAPKWNTLVSGSYYCQEDVSKDATGLGDCYHAVNLDSSVSDSYKASGDLMFNVDSTTAATTAASAYLLALTSKPTPVKGTFSPSSSFPMGSDHASAIATFGSGAINYRVQQGYYMLRVALENKNATCTDQYTQGSTGYWDNPSDSSYNQWRDATYPNGVGACTNDVYKIFQKSSLSSLH